MSVGVSHLTFEQLFPELGPNQYTMLQRIISNRVDYARDVDIECRCTLPGDNDGIQTCWVHHQCATSDCTHDEGGKR